jgi:predicted nucleotidyltransferase
MIIDTITKQNKQLSWMNTNTIFLCVSGSKAYNCQIESSDDDFKGICVPPLKYFTGFLESFDQAELSAPNPDAVIYSIKKFFALAINSSNPNLLEMLYVEPQHQLVVHPLMELILDKRQSFLSTRVRHSFGGFAFAQMKRLKLHRQWMQNPAVSPPTRKEMGLLDKPEIGQDNLSAAMAAVNKEMNKFNFNFLHNLTSDERIELKREVEGMLFSMKIESEDIFGLCCKKIGFDDNLILMMQKEREYNTKCENFKKYQNWLKTRNPARFADEQKYNMDLKFAYHIVRIYRTCEEILLQGRVNVFRPDREEMLEIRRGGWTYERLEQYSSDMDKRLDELYKTTTVVPHDPDRKALNLLCQEVTEKILKIRQ